MLNVKKVTAVLVCAALSGSIPAAFAASWDKTISEVETKAEIYGKKGRALGGLSLGSAYGAFRMDEHKCVILGYMLHKNNAVEHIDVPTKTNLISGDDYVLEATSLYNWAHMAKFLKGKATEFKIKLWNRECAGHLEIPASERIEEASTDAFYQVSEDGRTLTVIGAVTDGYYNRFVSALNANPGIREIALGSDGGKVIEALKAGREIRLRRLDTVLFGDCFSACPLVFLGGVRRIVWAPHPKLGFHQVYVGDGEPIPLGAPIYRDIAKYVIEMGSDPRLFLEYMLAANSEEIFVPRVDDYCDGNVVTWAQRACGW